MITVAAGDSFVWGSELSDSANGGPTGYSRRTFPALLSGNNYICLAYPGIGNQEIAQRVIDRILINCGVIVCWTWPSRDNELNSDKHIIKLQNYLTKTHVPYMFTCADNCVVTGNSAIDYTRWFMFPPSNRAWETTTPRGFYQWAVENKYQCGKEKHPLEFAHRDAAELMKEKFNELVKKTVQ